MAESALPFVGEGEVAGAASAVEEDEQGTEREGTRAASASLQVTAEEAPGLHLVNKVAWGCFIFTLIEHCLGVLNKFVLLGICIAGWCRGSLPAETSSPHRWQIAATTLALLAAMLCSGYLCARSAWMCRAPLWGYGLLPVQDQRCLWYVPLLLLFGLGQLVVVVVALEELTRARGSEENVRGKFHCKAVNGLFDSLAFSLLWRVVPGDTVTAAFGEMDFLKVFTGKRWDDPSHSVLPLSIFFLTMASSGLNLLELDRCTSLRMSERLQNPLRVAQQLLFRTIELLAKWWALIHIYPTYFDPGPTQVTCIQHPVDHDGSFVFVPWAVDLGLNWLAIYCFCGSEGTSLVRLLLAFVSSFANVFEFIDSPFKVHAAKRMSRFLRLKALCYGIGAAAISFRCSVLNRSATDEFLVACFALYWLQELLEWGREMFQGKADLCQAAMWGTGEEMISALQVTSGTPGGRDVNSPDVDGKTLLMHAVEARNREVCAVLLREAALIETRVLEDTRSWVRWLNKAVDRQWTALHYAAQLGDAEILEVLLGLAAEFEEEEWAVRLQQFVPLATNKYRFQDNFGETPLHVAAKCGHAAAVRMLAQQCPCWLQVPNKAGMLPRSLLTGGAVEIDLQPNSASRAAYGIGRQVPRRMSTATLWAQRRLHVNPEGGVVAPGLCSFIAASCGGALGRIFAAAAREPQPETDSWSTRKAQSEELVLDGLKPVDANGALVENCPSTWQRILGSGRLPFKAQLGRGSFGAVYRVLDQRTGEQLALKHMSVRQRTVAERESTMAELVLLMPHPNLVQVRAVFHLMFEDAYGAQSEHFLIVMQLCEAGNLSKQIRRARGSRPYVYPSMALSWVAEIFLALEHLHLRMAVLHRDIKPDNVLLSQGNVAKVTDFGLGRLSLQATGAWTFGHPCGTLGFVAPEVFRHKKYDAMADMYSFGVLVWELFSGGLANTGGPPVMADTGGGFEVREKDQALLWSILNKPTATCAPLDQEVLAFVSRLVTRSPSQRLQHEGVRQHPLFQGIHPSLPSFDASPDEVEHWLHCNHPQALSLSAPAQRLSSSHVGSGLLDGMSWAPSSGVQVLAEPA